jgi:hypothetical protein
LKTKIDTAERAGHVVGNDSSPIIPETLPAFDNEEWTWMVAEDPAFYLSTGRAENTGG